MNKATKRMLLAYDGGEDDREMTNRRRDYRSEYRNDYRNDYRDEYEDGYRNEYAYGNNMRYEYDEPEDKYDRRGRRHYKNGRYAPMNSYDDPMEYQDRDLRNIGAMSTMRMIGFDGASSSPEKKEHKQKGQDKLTMRAAQYWVQSMENEDGSRGEHWTLEQIERLANEKDFEGDKLELWVTMNMMYSDYFKVAKKFNVNNTDFYLELSKAFLDDKDAGDEKLFKYFECVVE